MLLIEKVKDGKEIKYKLKEIDKIVAFLFIYNYELSDDSVNIWLIGTKFFSPKNIDLIFKNLYNIFPHLYYA